MKIRDAFTTDSQVVNGMKQQDRAFLTGRFHHSEENICESIENIFNNVIAPSEIER